LAKGDLQVSRATARFIAEGHPWVRPDRFTVGLGGLKAGAAVTLVTESGERIASALADPGAEVCARVFHTKPDMKFDAASALDRAIARRSELYAASDTDCFRVVHGEADHLPGLRVERYGDVYVVVVLATCAAPYVDAVCQRLRESFSEASIVVRDHRDDLRREDVRSRLYGGGELISDATVIGTELGVSYPLLPFDGLATGLYVDQRQTRVWLNQQASGARVLNLFAYTGAFSLSLLAAGAASAIDVDLAGPPLKKAEEAAQLNGLADRHLAVKTDCRAYLEAGREEFDMIIIDPPTAAMGREGWVLRRDYPTVLGLAFARLAPGGLLVACCNTIGGKPYPLREAVTDAARKRSLQVKLVDGPSLGLDIPQLKGFPEGRPFRLAAARRT